MWKGSHHKIIGIKAPRTFALGSFDFGSSDGGLNSSHDTGCDAVLKVKHVLNGAIVVIGPQMGTSCSINKLCRDADSSTRTADAAFNDISDAQSAADLLNLNRSLLVG